MNSIHLGHPMHQTPYCSISFAQVPIWKRQGMNLHREIVNVHLNSVMCQRKPPKYLRYPRRNKLPSDPGFHTSTKLGNEVKDYDVSNDIVRESECDDESIMHDDELLVWEADEIEAISSLFQGRIPQKPGKLNRDRPLPLPLPYKIRPLGLPTLKKRIRPSRLSLSNKIYKDPVFLINLAREIRRLSLDKDVSIVLNKCGRFLRKGSLSLTIRELSHMGLPDRALQTFCWAQKQTHLFPDDRILATTVEILARTQELKLPLDLEKFISLASRGVLEAMVKGFIKGGSLSLAWRLLSTARKHKRVLNTSIYAKLILELGKSPDRDNFVITLLGELSERDTVNFSMQDSTAIMKVCSRLQKFEVVDNLFDWFQKSGNQPSLVMYTTVIHSRLLANKYREGLALVWEMEKLDLLFDLPAYRVVIKLFVALNDVQRAMRYFSKMKDAGFSPTYDLYRDMIYTHLLSGRFAKCKEICKEVELSGFKLDAELSSHLLQLGTY